jgi:proline iminopeptidase
MRAAIVAGWCALAVALPSISASPRVLPSTSMAHEVRIRVGKAQLYARDIGHGRPLIVLHGGPDFDHRYLLPDLDRLANAYRLIYYDQRGRGMSAEGVQPGDVTVASEIEDLERVREHFHLKSATILGHSWGTLIALEYAIRHPDRVSRLILMNPGPASHADYLVFRQVRIEKLGPNLEKLKAFAASDAYKQGDPDTVAAYYRVLFSAGLKPSVLDKLVGSLRASFTREGVLKARAIETRLVEETWQADGFDLLPKLGTLKIPTLVIYSDRDFIPESVAAHIAQANPHARMVTLKDCGHFSYMECPAAVRTQIDAFFRGSGMAQR